MGQSAETSRTADQLQEVGNTGNLISSYYLEIDYLLDRITCSSTHYQALGLDYSASAREIVRAYHDAVRMLHHPNRKVRSSLPEDMQERIDQACLRTSEAFLVLTDPAQRSDYDRSLGRKGSTQALFTSEPVEPQAASPTSEAVAAANGAVNGNPGLTASPESSAETQEARENRRRAGRIKIALPTHVMGYERSGQQWKEITKTMNVSRTGAAVTLNRHLKHGVVLHLRLPMPERLRCHGYGDPTYNVYAIVRRVESPANGSRIVGLEFIGEAAPPGYLDKPWTAYRSRQWTGCDRRREPRQKRSEQVQIEFLDETLNPIAAGKSTTEDLSASGARLIVKASPADFELVRIRNSDNSFMTLAEVRNRFVDDDGRERLCVRFTEKKWPV
ncbi:MAG: PilZ domain-containing protein [Blastocatellia bacterium]